MPHMMPNPVNQIVIVTNLKTDGFSRTTASRFYVPLRLCAMTFFVILPHQNAMSMLVSYQKIQANFFCSSSLSHFTLLQVRRNEGKNKTSKGLAQVMVTLTFFMYHFVPRFFPFSRCKKTWIDGETFPVREKEWYQLQNVADVFFKKIAQRH